MMAQLWMVLLLPQRWIQEALRYCKERGHFVILQFRDLVILKIAQPRNREIRSVRGFFLGLLLLTPLFR